MLASLVAIPFVGALLPPIFRSRLRLDPAVAAAIVAGVALVVLVILTAAPFRGETLIVAWQWLPSIGLDVAFRFDGLGMLLHQARAGFRAWFGVDPEVDADLRAAVLAARDEHAGVKP